MGGTGASAAARVGDRVAAHALLLLLLPATGLFACDAILGGGPAVEGRWALQAAADYDVYLEITGSDVAVYAGSDGDCFVVTIYDIIGREGEQYTLDDRGSDFTTTVIFRREGAVLRAVDARTPGAEGQLYESTAAELEALEVCDIETGWGGKDPAVDCAALPAVAPGQSINGQLTADDPAYGGTRFDLYGLTLPDTRPVGITVSAAFDPYLWLYEADGTYLADDDDGGAGQSAALEIELGPGCYRIEVTSFEIGVTGAYTLSVD